MKLEIVPHACKESKNEETGEVIPPSFEGSVTIKLPSMPESYRFKAKFAKRYVDVDTAKMSKAAMDVETLDLIAAIAEEIRPFFLEVKLKDLENGKEITSAEELFYYEDGFGIIADIGMRFVKGFAEKNS
jgi:hypothetical protein